MSAIGIIAELNPFHSGHAFLLEQVKNKYPDKPVIFLMSGNFVQRGSFAIQEKYSRAKCAILAGADLVLELPFPFSMMSAETFAATGIQILSKIGVCDTLAFGSEVSDLNELEKCAENLSSEIYRHEFSEYMLNHKGCGYPFARQEVYEKLFGKTNILSSSNASLAIEYLMQNRTLEKPFTVFCVKRKGNDYLSDDLEGDIISATACRKIAFDDNWDELRRVLPEYVYNELWEEKKNGRFPVNMEALSPALFYQLRTKSKKELSSYYGFSALCDRAIHCIDQCNTIEGLIEKIGFSGCTDSRIRRALLSVLLQVPKYSEKQSALFSQVLAIGQN